MMWTEVLQSRRENAADRAAAAAAYRNLFSKRAAEHAEFTAAMTERLAQAHLAARELEGLIVQHETRAQRAESRLVTETEAHVESKERVRRLEQALDRPPGRRLGGRPGRLGRAGAEGRPEEDGDAGAEAGVGGVGFPGRPGKLPPERPILRPPGSSIARPPRPFCPSGRLAAPARHGPGGRPPAPRRGAGRRSGRGRACRVRRRRARRGRPSPRSATGGCAPCIRRQRSEATSSAASTARNRDTASRACWAARVANEASSSTPRERVTAWIPAGVASARSSARAEAALYSTIITPDAAGVPSPRNGCSPVYAGSASIVSRARLSWADWATASTSESSDCTRYAAWKAPWWATPSCGRDDRVLRRAVGHGHDDLLGERRAGPSGRRAPGGRCAG